jgi:hypothetical protein
MSSHHKLTLIRAAVESARASIGTAEGLIAAAAEFAPESSTPAVWRRLLEQAETALAALRLDLEAEIRESARASFDPRVRETFGVLD